MDAGKRRTLIEISYEIRACGVCAHAAIDRAQDWGECTLHTYVHQKHTGGERPLSIHRCGVCPDFQVSDTAVAEIHGFAEFLP